MRLKSWFWISALALFVSSLTAVGLGRNRGSSDRSGDTRGISGDAGRSFPDDKGNRENGEREKEWREFLKESHKAYREWTGATREEQKEFEKYLRDRRHDDRAGVRENESNRGKSDGQYGEPFRDHDRDGWRALHEGDRVWQEYLKERRRSLKDFSRASRRELDEFFDYLRSRGYSHRERYWWDRDFEPRNGACFYTDSKYGGERFCLDRSESVSFVGDHFNDRISSIQIFGRARVTIYKHKNYGGSRHTYADDARHLGDFNDEISAIKVR